MKKFLIAKQEQPVWWLVVKLIILVPVLVLSINKIQDEGAQFEPVLVSLAAVVLTAENGLYLYRKSQTKS